MPDVKPQQLGVPEKEPVIYTIPDQFYGVAAKAKVAPEKPAPAAAAPPSPAPAAGAPAAPKPAGGKKWLLIPIGAVVILALSGIAVWYFVLRKPAPPAPARPAVTLEQPPAPAPEPVSEEVPPPEEEAPPPEEAVPPEPQPEPVPTAPTGAPDADNDGLSDAEEALYGTSAQSVDSDGDGYSDSVEVINLYNPAGFKPTKLIEAGLVKEFAVDGESPSTLLYPSKWEALPMAQDPGHVIVSPEGQEIDLTSFLNAEGKSVLDYYLSSDATVSPSQVQPFYTKSGLEGVRSPDGLKAYVSIGGYIFVFRYNVGAEGAQPLFRSTFAMILNSFSQKP